MLILSLGVFQHIFSLLALLVLRVCTLDNLCVLLDIFWSCVSLFSLFLLFYCFSVVCFLLMCVMCLCYLLVCYYVEYIFVIVIEYLYLVPKCLWLMELHLDVSFKLLCA